MAVVVGLCESVRTNEIATSLFPARVQGVRVTEERALLSA